MGNGDELKKRQRGKAGIFKGYSQGRLSCSGVIADTQRGVSAVNSLFGMKYHEPRDIVQGGNRDHILAYARAMKMSASEFGC